MMKGQLPVELVTLTESAAAEQARRLLVIQENPTFFFGLADQILHFPGCRLMQVSVRRQVVWLEDSPGSRTGEWHEVPEVVARLIARLLRNHLCERGPVVWNRLKKASRGSTPTASGGGGHARLPKLEPALSQRQWQEERKKSPQRLRQVIKGHSGRGYWLDLRAGP
jgi:hypothetical protein